MRIHSECYEGAVIYILGGWELLGFVVAGIGGLGVGGVGYNYGGD
jgi:hypothetical protein